MNMYLLPLTSNGNTKLIVGTYNNYILLISAGNTKTGENPQESGHYDLFDYSTACSPSLRFTNHQINKMTESVSEIFRKTIYLEQTLRQFF